MTRATRATRALAGPLVSSETESGPSARLPGMAVLLEVGDKLGIYSVGELLASCRRMVTVQHGLIVDLGDAEQVASILAATGLDTVVLHYFTVEVRSEAA